ncbi:hypothetical protein HYU10_03040 [Candidatus Woesearchaeota archaeon]|nr:hypothetical protein [Candidatus Woesearchaeota archaeon]MBI2130721.1 hypothetical protein [Candidatus Woesearchaeota archaeon]
MKLLQGKKAEGQESQLWAVDTMPFWIIFAILLAFTATFNVIYLSSMGYYKLNTGTIGEYVLIKRFLYSPNCFILSDGRNAEPNVIDYQKFTQDSLNACFKPSGTDSAFSITLNPKEDIFTPETIKTANWETGSKISKRQVYNNFLVYYAGARHETELKIEVQNA